MDSDQTMRDILWQSTDIYDREKETNNRHSERAWQAVERDKILYHSCITTNKSYFSLKVCSRFEVQQQRVPLKELSHGTRVEAESACTSFSGVSCPVLPDEHLCLCCVKELKSS